VDRAPAARCRRPPVAESFLRAHRARARARADRRGGARALSAAVGFLPPPAREEPDRVDAPSSSPVGKSLFAGRGPRRTTTTRTSKLRPGASSGFSASIVGRNGRPIDRRPAERRQGRPDATNRDRTGKRWTAQSSGYRPGGADAARHDARRRSPPPPVVRGITGADFRAAVHAPLLGRFPPTLIDRTDGVRGLASALVARGGAELHHRGKGVMAALRGRARRGRPRSAVGRGAPAAESLRGLSVRPLQQPFSRRPEGGGPYYASMAAF